METRTSTTTPDVRRFHTWAREHGNVMTPTVVEVKRVTVEHDDMAVDVYVELSRGRMFSGGTLWGVSAFVPHGNVGDGFDRFGRWATDDLGEDVARPFHDELEARNYYRDGVVDELRDVIREVTDR